MSGTYHSRVFTFVNKRTNQLKDSCAKGWRHLKVAAVWSGQILLYPLHVLAQTAKIFHPEIPAPPSPAALPQPAPDINIEQALDLVVVAGHSIQIVDPAPLVVEDDWSFIDESLWNISHGSSAIKTQAITYSPRPVEQVIPLKPTIRGLSSLLSDRSLVLVTTTNDLLDLLTITQQQEIRRRIGMDLAVEWQEWQPNQAEQRVLQHQQLLLANAQIEQFDRSQKLPSQNLVDHHQPQRKLRIGNWLQKLVSKPRSQLAVQGDLLTEFVRADAQIPNPNSQLAPAQYAFTPQPPRIDRYLELPQLPPIFATNSISTIPIKSTSFAQDLTRKFQPQWFKQWWYYYQDYLKIPEDKNSEIIYQPDEFQLIPLVVADVNHQIIQQTTKIQIQPELHPAEIHQRQTKLVPINQHHLEYHQDWIETSSENIGYSQSPFSKLLAWFDRIILKIENRLIKIWQQIRGVGSGEW